MRRHVPAALVVAALVAAALPGGAAAQLLCSEPLAPICTDLAMTDGDPLQRQQCTSDIDGYRQELVEYIDCLESKLSSAEAQDRRMVDILACLADEACDPTALEN